MGKALSVGVGLLFMGSAAVGLAQQTPAKAEVGEVSPVNLVRLGGGAGFPANGTGWITDRLRPGFLGTATYDRFFSRRWALEGGFSYLTNPVDTSGTLLSNNNLAVNTLGGHVGARADWLVEEKFRLYGDAGLGYYSSALYDGGALKDTASGFGLPIGLGGEVFPLPRFSLDLRVGYLPLFMSQGASFNSLDVQLLVGTYWGKRQPLPAKPKERDPFWDIKP